MSDWVAVNLQEKEDDDLDGAAATERNSEEIPHRLEAQQESWNKNESNLTKEMLDLRKLLTTVKCVCNPQQIDDRPNTNTLQKELNGKPLPVWKVGKFFNRKKGLQAQEKMLRNLLTKDIDSREDSPCDETDPTHTRTSIYYNESRLLREQVEMDLSNAGKAWNLVEAALSLETHWMKAIARDDMVFLTERLLQAREDYQNEHGKCYVDIAYHHTRKENLKTIATNGLLTKSERDKKNIKSIFHGSVYGDGIYCSSDPVKYAGRGYGDTTIVLARMRGIEQNYPARAGKDYNTLRVGSQGASNDFCVLQCSNQCIPLFHFPTHQLLRMNGDKMIAPETWLFYHELADFQDTLQHRLIDKFLNQNPYPNPNPTYSDRYWITSRCVHETPTVANPRSSSHSMMTAPKFKPSLGFVAAVCSGVAIGLAFEAVVLCTMIAVCPLLVVWVQSWTRPSAKQTHTNNSTTHRTPNYGSKIAPPPSPPARSTRPMKNDTNIFAGTGSFVLDFSLYLISGILGTVVGAWFGMPFVGMMIGAFLYLIFSAGS